MIYSENIKKPMASIQLAKASQAKGAAIGETMTITLTGKIVEVQAPREETSYCCQPGGGGKSRMMPGCITVEIEDISVGEASGSDDV